MADTRKLIIEKINQRLITDNGEIIKHIKNGNISLKDLEDFRERDVFTEEKCKFIALEHIRNEVSLNDALSFIRSYFIEDYISKNELASIFSDWLITSKIDINGILAFRISESESALFTAEEIKFFAKNVLTFEKSNSPYFKFEELIKEFINKKYISKEDIVPKLLSVEDFNRLLGIKPGPDIGPISIPGFEHLPPPDANRTNVFTIGIAGSGKSVFLAGLFFYVKDTLGALKVNLDHRQYVDGLTELLASKRLPPANPENIPIFIETDFKTKDQSQIPLTFFDMSGELFRQAYGSRLDNMPENLLKYIKHENNKVFMLVVDYNVKVGEFNQGNVLESIIDSLARDGVLSHTNAVCILITKWDESGYGHLSDNEQAEYAIDFLRSRYPNLVNICKDYSVQFQFKFSVFTYSIGNFDKYSARFTFSPEYSDKIYRWLCQMPKKAQPVKRGLFGKLFK
jgi:hypothetical protein